jgi:O-antigen ligase
MINYLKNLNLNYISSFLLIIFPISLVAGSFIAEISMNGLSIIFLYKIFKNKNFNFFRSNFFLVFLFFYIIVLLSVFFSIYIEEIFFKNFFYFRYILFTFAIVYLLKDNNNLYLVIYRVLCVVFLVLSIDGLIQFFFDHNILGNPKIRPDRLTGLFGDKMILGSYLSRILPLIIGLFFYNIEALNKRQKILGIFIIFISFITIFLSGERMPLISIIFYFISLVIFINISKKIKVLFFSIIFSTIIIVLLISPTIFDRHIKQTIDQVNFNFDEKNFFSNFLFYERTYATAVNGFLDRKIIGQGAKSFRYFCKEARYVDKLPMSYKQYALGNLLDNKEGFITKIFFKKDDLVRFGDPVFNYKINGIEKTFFIQDKIFPKEFYFLRIKLPPVNEQNKFEPLQLFHIGFDFYYKQNGCTTHPHNFYIQLLSETGIIGFITIFSIFIYLIFLVLRNYFFSFQKKQKNHMTNFQICLIVGFITTLLPVIPNGNFFNNWISMIIFYPVGFYLSTLVNKNKL